MFITRKAELHDVPMVFEMINHYVGEGLMLARPLTDLYESVREFAVAEEDSQVIGCGALKLYNPELGEIRSLCVAPSLQTKGVGRALMAGLTAEARQFGLKTVFALTKAPEFFAKCGFHEAVRERFPMKIWRDCLRCERYFRCGEITMALDLAEPRTRESASEREKIAVPV